MLFNYPSFYNHKEQSRSDLLYNSIKLTIQTNIKDIWYDLDFGTNIRSNIFRGIDNLAIAEIRYNLETVLDKYFSNDIIIDSLKLWQENDKIKVDLSYTEVRIGKTFTINAEQLIDNL